MAPVPEDNKDTPPNGHSDDCEPFSNPSLMIPVEDSSDSDDGEDGFGVENGYSLLPQEPDDYTDFNSYDETIYNLDNNGDSNHHLSSMPAEALGSGGFPTDTFKESALELEEGAAGILSSEFSHPVLVSGFPEGRLPSYRQLHKMPRDKEEHLWNQQRKESSKSALDPGQESKILKAMSQFSLPNENIPEWAKNMSDDQWQQQILRRIGSVSSREQHSPEAELSRTLPDADEKVEKSECFTTDEVWVADFADPSTSDTGQK